MVGIVSEEEHVIDCIHSKVSGVRKGSRRVATTTLSKNGICYWIIGVAAAFVIATDLVEARTHDIQIVPVCINGT
jgi:hypothetical protein